MLLALGLCFGAWLLYKAICNFGSRNYSEGYGNSHAGDSSAFSIVIVLLLIAGALVWSQLP